MDILKEILFWLFTANSDLLLVDSIICLGGAVLVAFVAPLVAVTMYKVRAWNQRIALGLVGLGFAGILIFGHMMNLYRDPIPAEVFFHGFAVCSLLTGWLLRVKVEHRVRPFRSFLEKQDGHHGPK